MTSQRRLEAFITLPANKEDYKAMYEVVIHHMSKAGIASDVLGYVGDFYEKVDELKNLAMLIKQFVVVVKRNDPENKIAVNALEYLNKHDLLGSCLRGKYDESA